MLERFGLSVHMAAAFAGTVAVLGASFGLAVGNRVEQEQESHIAAELADSAGRLAAHIDEEIGSATGNLAIATAGLKAAEPTQGTDGIQSWVSALASVEYGWLGYILPDGHVLVRGGDGPAKDEDMGQLAWFGHALKAPLVVEGNLRPAGDQAGEPEIILATPVRAGDGQVRAVLVASLPRGWLTALRDHALTPQQRQAGVELGVFDRAGRTILEPGAPPPISEIAQVLRWPDGKNYLTAAPAQSASYRSAGLDWRVVARQDATRAMAPAHLMYRHIMLVTGLLSLGGAVIGAAVSHRISLPLRRIADAAARIGSGEVLAHIPQLSYFREVAVLSGTLRDTIVALRREEARLALLNEGLEQRVQERTVEVIQTRDALAAQAAKLQAVIDTAIDGVLILGADGRVESFNPACETIFGWAVGDILGISVIVLMAEEAQPLHVSIFGGNSHADHALGHPRRVRGRRRDGSSFPMDISIARAEVGGQPFFVAILRDATQQEEARQRLYAMATLDQLTGLGNRHFFMEGAAAELARARRSGADVSLLLLDADHFKAVNDTYGHDAGDQVLRRLGDICRTNLRDVDLVGRLGGEEFAILMPETDRETARYAADRLRRLLADQVVMVEGVGIRFSVSIGLACLTGFDQTVEDLLRRADAALYQAKDGGRNRVVAAGLPPGCVALEKAAEDERKS